MKIGVRSTGRKASVVGILALYEIARVLDSHGLPFEGARAAFIFKEGCSLEVKVEFTEEERSVVSELFDALGGIRPLSFSSVVRTS